MMIPGPAPRGRGRRPRRRAAGHQARPPAQRVAGPDRQRPSCSSRPAPACSRLPPACNDCRNLPGRRNPARAAPTPAPTHDAEVDGRHPHPPGAFVAYHRAHATPRHRPPPHEPLRGRQSRSSRPSTHRPLARRHRPPRRLLAPPAPARLRRDRQHHLPRAPDRASAWSAPPSCSARGLTVREVAHRVGYRQPAQFAKAFRRHHGVSPSATAAPTAAAARRPLTARPAAPACGRAASAPPRARRCLRPSRLHRMPPHGHGGARGSPGRSAPAPADLAQMVVDRRRSRRRSASRSAC